MYPSIGTLAPPCYGIAVKPFCHICTLYIEILTLDVFGSGYKSRCKIVFLLAIHDYLSCRSHPNPPTRQAAPRPAQFP